ncbi:MAG TPA: hypothetical protein VH540_08925 [Ktedonobacterales bacterium]
MSNAHPVADLPYLLPLGAVAYHEAGHAVMARLIGRLLVMITYTKGPPHLAPADYEGSTNWGEDQYFRAWNRHVPYDRLGLVMDRDIPEGVALVHAAGNAAQEIWCQKNQVGNQQVTWGKRDGQLLKRELQDIFNNLNAAQQAQKTQEIKDWAERILSDPFCWQTVEVVVRASLEGLTMTPDEFVLGDVYDRIEQAFATFGEPHED